MSSGRVIEVTICGGGNGTHASAAVISRTNEFKVNVFTRRPKEWSKNLVGITKGSSWESRGNYVANLNTITSNPSEISSTDAWIISGPAHIHYGLLKSIAPYVKPGAFVGTLFAQGGFEWMCREIFGQRLSQITMFGLFNIPFICKSDEYGKSVRIIGPKDQLLVAIEPATKMTETIQLIEKMWTIPTVALPNFLTLTLTPSNQIIHPARIYGVFQNWDGKTPYDPKSIPLFYEDMDEYSAHQLELLDSEIQLIKEAIMGKYPQYDLTYVLPLRQRIIKQYGKQVSDHTNMYTTFRTNQGYKTVRIPVKEVQGGVIPNIDGRIFWEDVPYGLMILRQIADFVGVHTPNINRMIRWHQQFMNKQYILPNDELNQSLLAETGVPSRYGISNLDQLIGRHIASHPTQSRL
ncbi:hypothetical protein ABPG72_004926 [Tetrahymena utriculariae]